MAHTHFESGYTQSTTPYAGTQINLLSLKPRFNCSSLMVIFLHTLNDVNY